MYLLLLVFWSFMLLSHIQKPFVMSADDCFYVGETTIRKLWFFLFNIFWYGWLGMKCLFVRVNLLQPFRQSVKTKVGTKFTMLINKHFGSNHPYHRRFNMKYLKVSYYGVSVKSSVFYVLWILFRVITVKEYLFTSNI